MEAVEFKEITTKAGIYALPSVIFLLALNYWGLLALSKVPIPFFIDGLYVYTVLNGAAATPFIYLERKAKVAHGKTCPNCDSVLESTTNYKCPQCGEIRYENKK